MLFRRASIYLIKIWIRYFYLTSIQGVFSKNTEYLQILVWVNISHTDKYILGKKTRNNHIICLKGGNIGKRYWKQVYPPVILINKGTKFTETNFCASLPTISHYWMMKWIYIYRSAPLQLTFEIYFKLAYNNCTYLWHI